MNITKAVEELRALAKNSQRRSKTGHLRELYEEIELAQKAGVKSGNIVDALNDSGFEISHGSFVTLLHRIRKQKKSEAGEKYQSVPTNNQTQTTRAKHGSLTIANRAGDQNGPPTQQQLKEFSRSSLDTSQYEDDN
jgi:hypothetical protein